MLLAFQPQLVERTVFEAARRDEMIRREYERQFAACYDHRDEARRDQAFSSLHQQWFEDLGMRNGFLRLIEECPHISTEVRRFMVTQAPAPSAQTCELFGAPGKYSVVLAVAPATLLNEAAFEYWLRHELLHVEDMLDPPFGYEVSRRPRGASAALRNLNQDRYAVLWALCVDARLARRNLLPSGVKERRRAELARAFTLDDDDAASQVFEQLWLSAQADTPSHCTLIDWAEKGLPGIDIRPADASSTATAPCGGACSLCGFRTFEWAARSQFHPRLCEVIVSDFPNWNAQQPVCARCAEVYDAIAKSAPACA